VSAYVGSSKNLKDLRGGGLDVEAWPFYRTISGVRLCWELDEPKGPKIEENEINEMAALRSELKQGFSADPLYGRARCSPMLGVLKT